jgi:cellobiose phosphorylase
MDTANTWHFTGEDGSFILRSPHLTRYLYFPLANEAGMMSVVTPTLHGDVKTGQNEFLTLPVSVEDLHETRAARNFWAAVEGRAAWSATGNSSWQRADPSADVVTLEAGLLWHRVRRENPGIGLRAGVLSFVPAGPDRVELMQVTLTNVTAAPLTVTPPRRSPSTAARPTTCATTVTSPRCCTASAPSAMALPCARPSPSTSAATAPTL